MSTVYYMSDFLILEWIVFSVLSHKAFNVSSIDHLSRFRLIEFVDLSNPINDLVDNIPIINTNIFLLLTISILN